jgi:predicted Zn-dependent protease
LLLDRRKIRKWAKWVALGLAIVFALSFLFLGVGYGGAGFNISEIFSGGCSEKSTQPQTQQEKLDAFLATLESNPYDVTALLGAAEIYQDIDDFTNAATKLEKVIEVDPTQTAIYIRLANIYMRSEVGDYESAVTVLNKATTADPGNPEVYLKLGSAQKQLGKIAAAVLAWQKYLQLDPNGSMAQTVRDELEELTAASTTTTVSTSTTAAPTTTTAAPTTTTASATTTTAGPATTYAPE